MTTEQDPRWAAILARDPKADALFVYGVKTTGVYCRPSSASRLPRPENIEFFDTPVQAEAAGYRASKRAAGDQTLLVAHHAQLVAQACRNIEQAETPPSLNALAAQANLSPFHFHRVFKTVTGLTPKGYATAHRSRKVRDGLKSSHSVTDALYDAGFNSNSRFYESADQLLGMKPSDYKAGGTNTAILFAVGQCSLGAILVAQSARGVCAILLGEDPGQLVRDLQDQFPKAELVGADQHAVAAGALGFLKHLRSAWTCPWICAARHFRSGCGKPCAKFQRGARPVTRRSQSALARRNRSARWLKRVARTASRSPFPAIVWCAATATCRAIVGAWNVSSSCWSVSARVNPACACETRRLYAGCHTAPCCTNGAYGPWCDRRTTTRIPDVRRCGSG